MTKQYEIIYGIHPVRHALAKAQHDILELWVQENKKTSKEIISICQSATRAGVTVQYVSAKALDRITAVTTHHCVALKRRVSMGLGMPNWCPESDL